MLLAVERNMSITAELNLKYILSEVQWIDSRVRSALQAWLDRQPGAPDRLSGLYLSPEEALRLASSQDRPVPPAGSPNPVPPYPSEESRAIEQAAEQAEVPLRLLQLRRTFGLSDFEYAAFLVCLLPALELRYERIYGFLQDDVTKKQAGVSLILHLVETALPENTGRGLAGLEQLNSFSILGRLVKYRLLRAVGPAQDWQEPRLNQLYEVSPALVVWLMGDYFPEAPWLQLISLDEIEARLENSAFASEFEPDWPKILDSMPILAFEGQDEDRQELAAMKVAFNCGMPLLRVNLAETGGSPAAFSLSMLRLLIRDACLVEAIPYIQSWERVLDDEGCAPADLLEELDSYMGLLILSSRAPWRSARSHSRRPIFAMHFERPSSVERARLWQQTLGEEAALSPETLRDLSGQFVLTSGQIENAVQIVKNSAFQLDRPFSSEDLFSAARQQSSHHLGQLGQKMEPRYRWEDIILPPQEKDILRDVISNMRYRAQVLEEWGLGKKLTSSQGLAVLFTGEPGTGKTLAAQVIAAELRLDLYRVDLSNVVSKYIGETEKNLEKVFREAQNSNAILFFDEADALFGKRSEVKDAHDRYANIEVGYLLQRMETHDGMTILATNLNTNIDDAFTRRLQFIVHFPLPDEAQRLAIWKVLLPPGLPVEGSLDLEFMARAYTLSGGNIRNVLVAAAFLAAQNGGRLHMEHLLRATRREMQKMGRFIKEDDYIYPRKAG